MIKLGYWCIVLPHLFLFPTLYKNKEGIQLTPSEAMLEPPFLFTCLASVVKYNNNYMLPHICNLASKNHSWYPILLVKPLHSLVLQWMHKLNAAVHVLFGQLGQPEPSSCWFHLLKEHTHVELILLKMTGPVLIWMLLTCERLPQLVKPSFLLVNHL